MVKNYGNSLTCFWINDRMKLFKKVKIERQKIRRKEGKKKMNKKKKSLNRGITLIALVMTIVVLLILVGVTISTLTGENGILQKSFFAKEESNKKTATETLNLKITHVQMITIARNLHLKK